MSPIGYEPSVFDRTDSLDVRIIAATESTNDSANCANFTQSPLHTSQDGEMSLSAKIPIGIALEAIVVMTIGGNILVLLSVILNRKLRTVTNYFVVSLAVADLLLGLLVLPFSAILQLEKKWIFGKAFCDIWASTDVLCCTASILSLCAISIDRYIGITQPLKHRNIMSTKRTLVIIACLWVLSFAISLGPLIGWREEKKRPQECTVTKQTGYVIFSTLGSFYIPALIIISIYGRIYKEAIKQAEFLKTGFKVSKAPRDRRGNNSPSTALRAHTHRNASYTKQISENGLLDTRKPLLPKRFSSTRSETALETFPPPTRRLQHLKSEADYDSLISLNNGSGKESSKLKQLGRQLIIGSRIAKFNKEKRAAKTLGIVVGVFLGCWFPFFFILPLDSLCEQCQIPVAVFDVTFWLGYCNSMLNPIIYATWNNEFKSTFIKILKCQIRKRPRPSVVAYLASSSVNSNIDVAIFDGQRRRAYRQMMLDKTLGNGLPKMRMLHSASSFISDTTFSDGSSEVLNTDSDVGGVYEGRRMLPGRLGVRTFTMNDSLRSAKSTALETIHDTNEKAGNTTEQANIEQNNNSSCHQERHKQDNGEEGGDARQHSDDEQSDVFLPSKSNN